MPLELVSLELKSRHSFFLFLIIAFIWYKKLTREKQEKRGKKMWWLDSWWQRVVQRGRTVNGCMLGCWAVTLCCTWMQSRQMLPFLWLPLYQAAENRSMLTLMRTKVSVCLDKLMRMLLEDIRRHLRHPGTEETAVARESLWNSVIFSDLWMIK